MSFFFVLQVVAQSNTGSITIILVRHAEKDTTVTGSTMMQSDPPLSVIGIQRTGKLLETLKSYRFDSIFSTNFNRTRNTVMPIANKWGLALSIYDPKNQPVFAEALKKMDGKTILVVGHSNTIPTLVNILIGNAKYVNLGDNEYDKIWILQFKDGKCTETQIQY